MRKWWLKISIQLDGNIHDKNENIALFMKNENLKKRAFNFLSEKPFFFIFEMFWIFDGDREKEFLVFRFLRAFSPTNAELALRNEWNTPNNEDNEWDKLAKDKK